METQCDICEQYYINDLICWYYSNEFIVMCYKCCSLLICPEQSAPDCFEELNNEDYLPF